MLDRRVDGLGLSAEIDGRLELYGVGPVPAKILLLAECPGDEDIRVGRAFSDKRGVFLRQALAGIGLDTKNVYMTNLVKHRPKNGKIKAADLKVGRELLKAELDAVQPDLIICAGAAPVKEILGKSASLSSFRGMLLDMPPREADIAPFVEDPDEDADAARWRLKEYEAAVREAAPKPIKVFPIYNPGYIFRVPEAQQAWDADMNVLKRIIEGKPTTVDPPKNVVIHTVEELQAVARHIINTYEQPSIELDCEWEGNNYMEAGAYMRTIQLGYDDGKVVTIEMYDVDANLIVTKLGPDGKPLPWQDLPLEERQMLLRRIFQVLKVLLEHPRMSLSGHSIRSDGRWLLWNGIDIRENTTYDTMVAEHTIDSRGPFGLEALTMKYTAIGRYDKEVAEWLAANPSLCKAGFGKVPTEKILPYGAWDVEAPRQIRKRQAERLAPYLKPRGKYPSLFEADMWCSRILYELETEGLIVDRPQFDRIQTMYSRALTKTEVHLAEAAKSLGLSDFNPRAVHQVRSLLFDTLEMTPIKTTKAAGNKPWGWVMDQADDVQEGVDASTDKDTLSILADVPGAHPIVKLLRDYRKVSYVCANWLVDEEKASRFNTESRGGGLLSKIWPDGKLHARFSQLLETARLGASKPNVMNWMKRAEGELKRIVGPELLAEVFGADAKFPTLKSMIVPPPGHVFIEADWKQAEMFTLAALSGDSTMIDALNTPGKDLHDLTAANAFKVVVLDKNGVEVSSDHMVQLARRDVERFGTFEGHEFEAFQSTLTYLDQRGRRLTRKEWKDGPRTGGKALNFGIPYGRASMSIALQVKAETGSQTPIQDLKTEIDEMMASWKQETYVSAWDYMEWCAEQAADPGYIENPWGRRRLFAQTRDRGLLRAYGREAMNFPELLGWGRL